MRDDEEQGKRLDDEDVDDVAGGGGGPFEQSAPVEPNKQPGAFKIE